MAKQWYYTEKLSASATEATYELCLHRIARFGREDVLETAPFTALGFHWCAIASRCWSQALTAEEIRVALLTLNEAATFGSYRMTARNYVDAENNFAIDISAAALPFMTVFYSTEMQFEKIVSPDGGFLRDEAVTFVIEIKDVVDASEDIVHAPCVKGNDLTPLNREIISAESIAAHLSRCSRYGICSAEPQRHGLFISNELVHPLWTESQNFRLWLCARSATGSLNVLGCFGDVSPLDATFADVGAALGQRGRPWVTLYREDRQEGEALPTVDSDTLLIFAKYMDPYEEGAHFLGHVLMNRRQRCLTLLAELADRTCLPDQTEFEIFVEEGHRELNALPNLCASLTANGLNSGSIVVVKPVLELSTETSTPTQSRLPSTTMALSGSPYSRQVSEENMCVVCMSRPMISGFVHGITSHRCVCTSCAIRIARDNNPRCPLCRQPIQHTVLFMY